MKKIVFGLILICTTSAFAADVKVECSGWLSDGASASIYIQQFIVPDSASDNMPATLTLVETADHSVVLLRWSPNTYALRVLDKNVHSTRGYDILYNSQANLNTEGATMEFDNSFSDIRDRDLKFSMDCGLNP